MFETIELVFESKDMNYNWSGSYPAPTGLAPIRFLVTNSKSEAGAAFPHGEKIAR